MFVFTCRLPQIVWFKYKYNLTSAIRCFIDFFFSPVSTGMNISATEDSEHLCDVAYVYFSLSCYHDDMVAVSLENYYICQSSFDPFQYAPFRFSLLIEFIRCVWVCGKCSAFFNCGHYQRKIIAIKYWAKAFCVDLTGLVANMLTCWKKNVQLNLNLKLNASVHFHISLIHSIFHTYLISWNVGDLCESSCVSFFSLSE